jgi:hypothetical protein
MNRRSFILSTLAMSALAFLGIKPKVLRDGCRARNINRIWATDTHFIEHHSEGVINSGIVYTDNGHPLPTWTLTFDKPQHGCRFINYLKDESYGSKLNSMLEVLS